MTHKREIISINISFTKSTLHRALGAGIILALVAIPAWLIASQVGSLTTFAPGTPIRASEVNANFASLQSAVNENNARLVAVEQPYAFAAQSTGTQVGLSTGHVQVNYQDSSGNYVFDIGDVFDETTDDFTAPVDGVYWFSATARLDNPTQGDFRLYLTVNDGGIDFSLPATIIDYGTLGDPRWASISAGGAIRLSSGDTVQVRAASQDDTFWGMNPEGRFSGHLVSSETIRCPNDMAIMPSLAVCIDRYEASEGAGGVAISSAGNSPWIDLTQEQASAACQAAGKRLCSAEEWQQACAGPSDFTYAFGDTYDGSACNGGDYPATTPLPAGSLPRCRGGFPGIFDMSGNVAEWTSTSSDPYIETRGGTWGDAERWLRCRERVLRFSDENRTDLGFRCCRDELSL